MLVKLFLATSPLLALILFRIGSKQTCHCLSSDSLITNVIWFKSQYSQPLIEIICMFNTSNDSVCNEKINHSCHSLTDRHPPYVGNHYTLVTNSSQTNLTINICLVYSFLRQSWKNELHICDKMLKMKQNRTPLEEWETNPYLALPVCSLFPEMQWIMQSVRLQKWLLATVWLCVCCMNNWIKGKWQKLLWWLVCTPDLTQGPQKCRSCKSGGRTLTRKRPRDVNMVGETVQEMNTTSLYCFLTDGRKLKHSSATPNSFNNFKISSNKVISATP